MNPPPPFTGRRTPSTPRAPRESPPQWETRPASSPLLRPFPFTTPLHPLLYEKKERSGGRKGAADGSAGLPRTPGTAGQESHGATGGTMPKDSPAMVRVGLLGRS